MSARPSTGSLFTGFGGLTLAVEDVFDARPTWFAEYEPPIKGKESPQAAARVLAHRWPEVPNLGDVRRDWSAVDEVDITDGGYPCQGQSAAGKRLGMEDHRWMWPSYFSLIREIRPRFAVGENVRNHLNIDFRWVLADLQSIGYAVVWAIVAASDVGACHRRERLFWLAWDEGFGAPAGLPSAPFAVLEGGRWMVPNLFGSHDVDSLAYAGAAYAGAAYAGAAPDVLDLLKTPTAQLAVNGGSQHPDKRRGGGHGPTLADQIEHEIPLFGTSRCSAGIMHPLREGVGDPRGRLEDQVALLPTPMVTDAKSAGPADFARKSPQLRAIAGALLPTPRATDGTKGGPNQRGSAGDLMLPSAVQPERWGKFALAVARQETLTGPAPDPTILGRAGRPRLNPAFVEWMMWAPAGWFTEVPGITHAQALKLAGNGVVRPQGAAALRHLLRRSPVSAARVAS